MVGLVLDLDQKLPSRLLDRMAVVQCHIGSCCAPSSSSPAHPKLLPSCSLPSSSPCRCQCHSRRSAHRDPTEFRKQDYQGHHHCRAGRH